MHIMDMHSIYTGIYNKVFHPSETGEQSPLLYGDHAPNTLYNWRYKLEFIPLKKFFL